MLKCFSLIVTKVKYCYNLVSMRSSGVLYRSQFDSDFMLWRIGMYLPFAFFAGLVLKLRPQLLPYFVIVHALMDVSTLAVYWMI